MGLHQVPSYDQESQVKVNLIGHIWGLELEKQTHRLNSSIGMSAFRFVAIRQLLAEI